MGEIVVRADKLTKEYKLYNSEMDRLKEAFHPLKKSYHRPFYALKNVSFKIEKGEKVGIIGSNGAGKSTLLKILTEVLNQTSGEMEINGSVAALLELGAGFNPNYTGIENIKLNAALMGFTADELEEKTKKIIEFADIGEFINQPVKNYSSGMFVRLAFATQIFSEPDILIVDEALSVGDIRFQQKCYRAMDQLMKDKTVILVTHDTGAVTRFCQRVIWLNHGEVMFDGDTVEGLKRYQEYLINQSIEDNEGGDLYVDKSKSMKASNIVGDVSTIPELTVFSKPKGNGDAIITRAAILNENYEVIDVVEPHSNVKCVFVVEYKKHIERPILGFEVFDRLGNVIFSVNTEMINVQLPEAYGIVRYDLSLKIPLLNNGEYTISPGIASGFQNSHIQLCWIDDALSFKVPPREFDIPGFFYIDRANIEVSRVEG